MTPLDKTSSSWNPPIEDSELFCTESFDAPDAERENLHPSMEQTADRVASLSPKRRRMALDPLKEFESVLAEIAEALDSDTPLLSPKRDLEKSYAEAPATPSKKVKPAASEVSPISPEKLPTRLHFRVLPTQHQDKKGRRVDSASLCNQVRNRAFLAGASQRYMAEFAYALDKQDGAEEKQKPLYEKRAHKYSRQSQRANQALKSTGEVLNSYV
jgi:hypothetical protein